MIDQILKIKIQNIEKQNNTTENIGKVKYVLLVERETLFGSAVMDKGFGLGDISGREGQPDTVLQLKYLVTFSEEILNENLSCLCCELFLKNLAIYEY